MKLGHLRPAQDWIITCSYINDGQIEPFEVVDSGRVSQARIQSNLEILKSLAQTITINCTGDHS